MPTGSTKVKRKLIEIRSSLHLNYQFIYHLILFVIVAGLVILPLGYYVWGSLWSGPPGLGGHFTTAAYERILTNELFISSAVNTILLALTGTPIAMVVGVGAAILTTKTNVRGTKLLSLVLIMQFIIPGFVTGVAWTTLWGPQGIVNDLLIATPLFDSPLFDIYSVWGIIVTQGFASAPLAYLLTIAAIRSIPAALEEPGELNGATNFQIIRYVTLPLILPTLTITTIIIIARMIQTFTIPVLLGFSDGVFVLATLIYAALTFNTPPLFAVAAAIGVMLMAMIALLVIWQMRLSDATEKYETLGGQESTAVHKFNITSPNTHILSGVMILISLLYVIPFIFLIIGSFQHSIFFNLTSGTIVERFTLDNYAVFLVGEQSGQFYQVVTNSLLIGLGGAFVGMILASFVSHIIIKSDFFLAKLLDLTTVLSTGIPSVVVGTTFLWIALELNQFGLYGTKSLVVLAFTVKFIVYSTRSTNSSFYSIKTELEDSARVSGASLQQIFRYIYFPLIKPGFMSGFVLLFILYMKVLSIPLFLVGPNNEMLQVMIWLRWARGETGQTAALTIMSVILIFACYGLLYRYSDFDFKRHGPGN